MTRRAFGGDVASFVVTIGAASAALTANRNAAVTMWSAITGGSQYTDLKAADGTTSITSVTAGADGLLPQFYGPDGVAQLWANAPGSAERVLLLPTDANAAYVARVGDDTIRIAASNSTMKAFADVICTGSGDQTAINAAIAGADSKAVRVLFFAGEYDLSGPIIIDRDHVTLQGPTNPMWGAYLGNYPTNPVGAEGLGGAKLKVTVTGTDAIQILNTTTSDARDNRHRGIKLKSLYLYGFSRTGTGITATSAIHDLCSFEDLFIHSFNRGIQAALDSPDFHRVSVQDCADKGIYLSAGNYGTIRGCVIADIGGNCVESASPGTVVASCILVDANAGFAFGVDRCIATGNFIKSMSGVGAFTYGTSSRCVIANNVIDMTANSGRTATTTNPALLIGADGTSNKCSITGNVIYTPVAFSGYAIDATTGAQSGHTITGNTVDGSFNSGSATVIGYKTSGLHTVANNSGDVPRPPSYVTDSFTRANSTTTLGTATSGHTWIALSGTWGIVSNQAYVQAGASQNFAVIDTGKSDCMIQFKVSGSANTDQGFGVRMVDSNNGYLVALNDGGASNVKIYKIVAGSTTQLGTVAHSLPAGDTAAVVLNGPNIQVFHNGASILSIVDTTYVNQTKHGLWGFAVQAGGIRQWDDLLVA